MQKTRTDDETGTRQGHRHHRSTGFNIHHSVAVVAGGGGNGGDRSLVELTPDISNDSVAPPSVKPAGGADDEGPDKLASFASGPGMSSSSRSSWSAIRPLYHALSRLASSSKPANHQGRFERTKSTAAYALKGLKFTGGDGWPAVEGRFNALTASTNGLLLRSHFGECIGMKNSEQFAEELFDALARRREIGGDSINKDQLKEFWDRISDQSFDSRLETFVDMIDKDADGRITIKEMREIISLSASANKLSTIQKNADVYAQLFREKLDPENNGYIKIENLKRHILQASKNAKQDGISQKPEPAKESSPLRIWYRNTKYFLQDNWQRVWLVAAWTGAMLGLFAWKFVQYRNRAAFDVMGHCVCMAKGAAETLKLNMALILLPVCRNTITWLRNKTKLGVAVPFDDNINFHQMIAVAVAIGVAIHSICHLACDFPRLLDASPTKYAPMVQYFGPQPSSYWHFVKSFEGVSGIIMVVLMSIAFTLASPWLRQKSVNQTEPAKKPTGFNAFWSSQLVKNLTGFNAFWYSHHLFVIVYSLLIAHGVKLYLTHEWYNETTWMYLAVPITIYACERLIRVFRSNIAPVKISMVGDYGDVLALHMTKPKGFSYSSGQYVFVKCTAVSPFEWHPFSITSAPGDDYLSVHIRAAGDWTKQIKKMFFEGCDATHTGKSRLIRVDSFTRKNNSIFEKLSIDGPYGAPAQEYKNYEVVLLVGSGIGATPMISIVKDIVNNTRAMEEEENALENGTGGNKLSKKFSPKTLKRKSGINFKTKRAYFYWVTREQRSFSWFKEITKEVSEMDDKGVIEMHNHCTSIFKEGDARSAVITLLQSLTHDKNGEDIVAGTPVKCHFGRPDWEEVYQSIANKHPHTHVGVFYCGHPGLVGELKSRALKFFHTTSTKFEFHKENF